MCVVEAKTPHSHRPRFTVPIGLVAEWHAFPIPPHIYLCTQARSIVFPTASKSGNRNVRVCCIETMLEKLYINVIKKWQKKKTLLKSGVSYLIIQCFDFAWCIHCFLFSGSQERKQNTGHVPNMTNQPLSAKLPQGCRY